MNKKRVQEGEEFGVITELYIVKASRWHPLLSGDIPYCQVTFLIVCYQANYDLDQALVLCQMNNFREGILYLYEKARL